MTTFQIIELIDQLKSKGILFDKGLTEQENLKVEEKFYLKFPPDFRQFLQTALPVSEKFYNWRNALKSKKETQKIQLKLNWPLEGILFDIENNVFWCDQWGNIPDTLAEKFDVARRYVVSYPKLVPVYSHRFIPGEPFLEGNPVFSVYQTDIIYYGYDLASYFANEFHFALSDNFELIEKPKRTISFWTWVVENNEISL
jgi:hypothetical protein